MFPVISRALTPAPRARRIFALSLALALGAVPVGTSAIASHQAVAHAAEPAAANGLIKLHQPKDDPSYVECVANFVGTMNATPGVWAVCHGYLDSEEYTVTRRHSTATVTRGQLVRMLYRMADRRPSRTSRRPRPTRMWQPPTPTMLHTFGQRMRASPPAGMTGSSTRMTTLPATPLPRSSTAPQVAPTVPHTCARFAAPCVPKSRRLNSSRPKTAGQPAPWVHTPKWTATVTGAADVVDPASPLYFSDALYMLKAYGDKGLKVVGTPAVD